MADNEALVPAVPIEMAKLNITYQGQNGDLPDFVSFDATDGDIKQMAAEAVRDGYVPGIGAFPNATFRDFVVDRFQATDELPYNRLMLRPKTPFGMRGYTLVEILVVIGILGVVVSVLFGAMGSACVGHKDSAQASLAKYAQDMGYEVEGSTCVNKDTDGDGYVSCTAKLKGGKTLNVECVGWQGMTCVKNEGCRAPKLKMPSHTTTE